MPDYKLGGRNIKLDDNISLGITRLGIWAALAEEYGVKGRCLIINWDIFGN
jgi:hypothetical protein